MNSKPYIHVDMAAPAHTGVSISICYAVMSVVSSLSSMWFTVGTWVEAVPWDGCGCVRAVRTGGGTVFAFYLGVLPHDWSATPTGARNGLWCGVASRDVSSLSFPLDVISA